VQRSDTRTRILTTLKQSKPTALGPSAIAAAADLKETVVKVQLGKMLVAGEVIKAGRGLYAHP
jgi:hypothetical protein